MSDMLYLKQTQLERLAAEKAAQQLKTERELEAARQVGAGAPNGVCERGGGRGITDVPVGLLADYFATR